MSLVHVVIKLDRLQQFMRDQFFTAPQTIAQRSKSRGGRSAYG